MTERVTTERRGEVLLIGLNRADKRNAFDPEMVRQLSEAYTLLANDKSLRCGVLHAHGEHFTAGLDMPAIAKQIPLEPFKPMVPRGGVDPWGVTTAPCPKPIVTAVQGVCYTLGIELMLCGQVTIAADSARFIQYEVSRGLFPFGGGTVRWPLAVGTHNAYRYLLTGDPLDAAEALRIGLVQKVVPAEQCLAEAVAMAERIAAQAPLGVQATLRNVRLAESKGSEAALGRLRREILKLLLSKDIRRGLQAFKERREARYEGN